MDWTSTSARRIQRFLVGGHALPAARNRLPGLFSSDFSRGSCGRAGYIPRSWDQQGSLLSGLWRVSAQWYVSVRDEPFCASIFCPSDTEALAPGPHPNCTGPIVLWCSSLCVWPTTCLAVLYWSDEVPSICKMSPATGTVSLRPNAIDPLSCHVILSFHGESTIEIRS